MLALKPTAERQHHVAATAEAIDLRLDTEAETHTTMPVSMGVAATALTRNETEARRPKRVRRTKPPVSHVAINAIQLHAILTAFEDFQLRIFGFFGSPCICIVVLPTENLGLGQAEQLILTFDSPAMYYLNDFSRHDHRLQLVGQKCEHVVIQIGTKFHAAPSVVIAVIAHHTASTQTIIEHKEHLSRPILGDIKDNLLIIFEGYMKLIPCLGLTEIA